MKFKVKDSDFQKRLDKFLTEKISDQTRSQIKKLIQRGQILVDGQPAKVHRFLKVGEIVTISKLKQPESAAEKSSYENFVEPKIIFENKDFLVIDKPKGLLVHPTERGEANTLVDWLKKKYPDIEQVGEQRYRGGIIHRLDKDVSGVMVVVKTNDAFNHLKNQFKNREVKKEYLAMVYGKIEKSSGEIDLPIGRNKDGQFVAHPRSGSDKFDDSDKLAKTLYTVIEYVKDFTLLKVQILTGRTHQIRAHFSAIGHPILGDQIYKPKKKFFRFLRRKIKVINPGRIFLHSTKIGFKDLNNTWQEYQSSLPQNLKDFINEQKTK